MNLFTRFSLLIIFLTFSIASSTSVYAVEKKVNNLRMKAFTYELAEKGDQHLLTLRYKGNLVAQETFVTFALTSEEMPKLESYYSVDSFEVSVRDLPLLSVDYNPTTDTYMIKVFYAEGTGPYEIKEIGHQHYFFLDNTRETVKGMKEPFNVKLSLL